jgi:hypothetical protein
MAGEFFSVNEAGRRLGVPGWQVRRLYDQGKLPPPRRIGLWRLLTVDDLPAITEALRRENRRPRTPKGRAVLRAARREAANV